jgi:hypothetical protein
MNDRTVARPSSRRITVPTELAALAAGVTVATVRKWASRGKLTRYGSPGRAEYDLDEISELIAKVCRRRLEDDPVSSRESLPPGE